MSDMSDDDDSMSDEEVLENEGEGSSNGIDSEAWRAAKQAWRDSRQGRDELEALSSSGRSDARETWRNARPSIDDYRM